MSATALKNDAKWIGRFAAIVLASSLISIERFLIVPMFPTLTQQVDIPYRLLPIVSGITALSWGLAAIPASIAALKFGIRNVLAVLMVAFAVATCLPLAVVGFKSLLAARLISGLLGGAVTIIVINAIMITTSSKNRGLAVGIQQAVNTLLALGLTPIIAVNLLPAINWRWLFAGLSIPSLVFGGLLYMSLSRLRATDPPADDAARRGRSNDTLASLILVTKSRGVWAAAFLMGSSIGGLVLSGALLPGYLEQRLCIPPIDMGYIMSAIGFGGILGGMIIPGLSDRLGRKAVIIACAVASLSALTAFCLSGSTTVLLFSSLFLANFASFPLIPIAIGPLCAEAVTERHMGLASGFVLCLAEFVGGGALPGLTNLTIDGPGGPAPLLPLFATLAIGLAAALAIPKPRDGTGGNRERRVAR